MTVADLSFLADCLRFIALPAVAFEMLREERRNQIDHVLAQRAWRLLKWSGTALALILALVFLSVLISQQVWISAWIVLAIVAVGLLIADSVSGDRFIFKWLVPTLAVIGLSWGAFEIVPRGAMLSDWSLFSQAERHLLALVSYNNGAPIYSPEAVSETLWMRDELEDAARENLWSQGYFQRLFTWDNYARQYIDATLIIAKALSIQIFILLNMGVIIFVVTSCIIPFALAVNSIYWLSNAIKSLFKIEAQARYPLGAAALLAIAEVISFLISANLYFSGV